MKLVSFFILFIFLNLYFNVECVLETIKKFYDVAKEPVPTEAEEASLVLGVEESSNFCIIANIPILRNRKNPNFGKYLFACPPETEKEIEINKKKSKTSNALFIKKTYGNIKLEDDKKKNSNKDQNNVADPSDFDEKNYEYVQYNCKHPVGEPSIEYLGTSESNGTEIDAYLIGFEIYFEEKYKKLNFVGYNKLMNLNPGFQWFNVLTIRIDRKKGNVMTVTAESFNDDFNFPAPELPFAKDQTSTKFNFLGHEIFFPNFWIGEVYSEMRQSLLFRKLFKDSSLKDLYYNKAQGRYLTETYLAPSDSFVNPMLKKAALTYANIVPMWKVIRDMSWARLENHIKHLVQGIYGVLVINGTYGTLKLSGVEINLGPRKGVRVPLAFYKIVTYPRKFDEFYNMLIITMNNPYEDVSHGLCEKSQCKEFGWDYIEEDYYPYGRTSCCELTEDVIKKLQLHENIKEDHVLNLRAVPHWNIAKLTLNVTNFIEDRKKGFSFNPHMGVEHLDYRNEPEIELESEKKPVKKDGKKENLEDFSLSQFAFMVFKNYVVPGLTTLTAKTKDYAESKASPLLRRRQNSDDEVEKPFLGDQKDEAEKDPVDDQKNETGVEKPFEQNDVETSELLESDQKDENGVENSLPSDQKDDEVKHSVLN